MNVCDVRAWKACEELAAECGVAIDVTDNGVALLRRGKSLVFIGDNGAFSVIATLRAFLWGYEHGLHDGASGIMGIPDVPPGALTPGNNGPKDS